MNINKVELGVQLDMKEQMGLKCIQFTTEYLLKKAQYRLLNPLHSSQYNISQLNKHSQLISQLNTYSQKIPKIHKKILTNTQILTNTNSKIQNNKKIQTPNNIIQTKQILFQPYLHQNQTKSINHKNKQKQKQKHKEKPIQSKQKPIQSKQIYHQKISNQQQQSKSNQSQISQYNHVQLQRTSSEIINNNRSSNGSNSSIKSKPKFEKVYQNNKKTVESYPQKNLNFKKKPSTQIQQPKSLISNQNHNQNIRKNQKEFNNEFSDTDSNDSFQNFPLPSAQKPKLSNDKQIIILTDDMKSYRSSILSQKKVQIDIVSQHLSQNQISILNDSQILGKQIRQNNILLNHYEQNNIEKRQNIEGRSKLIDQKQFQSLLQKRDNQQDIKRLQQKQNQQDQARQRDEQIQQEKDKEQEKDKDKQQEKDKQRLRDRSLEQIRRNLLRLQSFDVQQEMIMKKVLKIWTNQSKTIKQLKNMQWNQLNLPKHTLKSNTHLYAQIIE